MVRSDLISFSESKEESAIIGSVMEYEKIVGRLTRIEHALTGLPVAKRVAKTDSGVK